MNTPPANSPDDGFDDDFDDIPNDTPADLGAPGVRPLRYWPALFLIAMIWMSKAIPLVLPGSFEGFMASMFGPLLAAVLMLVWWVCFSAATWQERIAGSLGLLVAGFVANMLCDKSVQGFGMILGGIPWAATWFIAAATVLSVAQPRWRTGIPLLAASAALFYQCLFRVDGIWGDMETTRLWRWELTKQEEFDALLKTRKTSAAGDQNADWTAPQIAEWGEFRGPARDGRVPGIVLLEDWDRHPPREQWRIRIGSGWGSFCVVGNRLFTQEQRGEEEAVVCYDADTGREIWSHTDPGKFEETVGGPGPRATPTYHDGKLYTMGAAGTVNCLDARTGQAVWTHDLKQDSGAQPPMWGFSSSPLVTGNLIVVHAGGTGVKDVDVETQIAPQGLVAYDAATGEVRWTAPSGQHSYSSPQLWQSPGEGSDSLILMLTNSGLAAHEPATGKTIWEHPWKFDGYRVVQPLVVGSSSFLLGTTMGVGTRRVDVGPKSDGYQIKESWTTTKMKPYFNDYVEHQGYLFGFDHDLFACLDLETGTQKWKKGRYGAGQVLLLPDRGQLLVMSEHGEIVLLSADPKQHRELGKIKVFEGKTWNHPVVVGNRLYVRNGQEAACYELAVAESESTTKTEETKEP